MTLLPEIFQYEFMRRALVAGLVMAIIAPLIGQFLVVRRYALMADTLAHVSLVGVALGLLLNTQPILTALVTTVIASMGIEKLRSAKKISGESLLALFLSGSLAIAIVLISAVKGFKVDLFSFLFGSITTVSSNDLILALFLAIILILVIGIFYRQLFLISFDEDLAKVDGLKTKTLNNLLVILTAIAVSIGIRVVGVLLIGALMVIPVITAIQFGKSFLKTLLIAISISLFSTIAGLVLSYYFDLASGGTIVLISLVFFLFTLAWNKK